MAFSRSQTSPLHLALITLIGGLVACDAGDPPLTPMDASHGSDASTSDASVPPDASMSMTRLDEKCRRYSQARVDTCGPEFESGYCGLGDFVNGTTCAADVEALFDCGLANDGNAASCSEESPCNQAQFDAFDCLSTYCTGERAYEPGCIALYGCNPDCGASSCGDDDRCGGTCTSCPSGQTCNRSAASCESDGGGPSGEGDTCSCGSLSGGDLEDATICNDCGGGLDCVEQHIASNGFCRILCDERDEGRRGDCPSGWTCFATPLVEAGSGRDIYTCGR